MKYVVGKFNVPILIAKKIVKFTKRQIVSLVTPSKLLVLEGDLLELAGGKSVAEAN